MGLTIDVSGLLKESFDNRSGSNTLHLAEFRRALGRTMDCARSRSASGADEPHPDACECLVFAYAFGLAEGSGIIDLLGMLDDRRVLTVLAMAGAIENVVTPNRIREPKDQFAETTRNASILNQAGARWRQCDEVPDPQEATACR